MQTTRPASIPPRALRARQRRLAFQLRDQAAEIERARLMAGISETRAFARLVSEYEATKSELADARSGAQQ